MVSRVFDYRSRQIDSTVQDERKIMRQITRIRFVLPVLCLVLTPISTSLGQSSKTGKSQVGGQSKSQPTAKQPAPKPGAGKEVTNDPARTKNGAIKQAANVEPPVHGLDPVLEDYLKKWAAESKKIKSIHGDQTRQEFNTVFLEEKRTKGEFFLQTPDKGRIDFLAEKIGKDEKSSRTDKAGNAYKLETGQSERWICNGEEILVINDEEKTIQRQEIPEEQRGANIVHSPLPFLFGMSVEESKERFEMRLAGESPSRITIDAIPKTEKDRQNFQKARIILNRTTWLPEVVQLLDESNMEIRYTFKNVKANDQGFSARLRDVIKGDPYHPKLTGYKEVLPPEKQEIAKPEVQKPPKVNNTVRRPNDSATKASQSALRK